MSTSSEWGTDDDLAKVVQLLREVFPHPEKFTVERLKWSYRDHPLGPAPVGRTFDSSGRQVGNYALIPIRLVNGSRSLMLGLGIDLAVSPSARGTGTFRETVEHSYAEAQRMGFDGILGIANAQSAPRMVKAMGWRHLPSMPTRLLVPASLGRGRSFRDASQGIRDAGIIDALRTARTAVNTGWHQSWDLDLVTWRLEMPGASYALHELPDCIAVSTTDRIAGMPVAVLLKVIPLRESGRVRGSRIAARLARFHRTPLVVYWGRNSRVALRGLRLPKRFQPSPLEVVLHLFDQQKADLELPLDDFELLDLDAY